MQAQLTIPFPAFADGLFDNIKKQYRQAELLTLEEKIKHLQYSIRTHKGHYTKLKIKTKK